LISICFVVLASFIARSTYRNTETKIENGAGIYSSRLWQESEIISYLRDSDRQEKEIIFSNAPDALYILADVNAEMSPRHSFETNSDVKTGIRASNLFERYPALDGALLVWCANITWREFLFEPADLKKMCQLDLLHSFSDGAIYRIRSYNNLIERQN
jgi:hypothetical protein